MASSRDDYRHRRSDSSHREHSPRRHSRHRSSSSSYSSRKRHRSHSPQHHKYSLDREAARLVHEEAVEYLRRRPTTSQKVREPPTRLFIGNVSYSETESSVSKLFGKFGPILQCSLPLSDGKHKGVAFVDFEKQKDAAMAEEQLDGYMLGDRALRVSRAAMPAQPEVSPTKVYLASVPWTLSDVQIRRTFEYYGRIDSLVMSREPGALHHHGNGTLVFSYEKDARRAASEMDGKLMGSSHVRVSLTPIDARSTNTKHLPTDSLHAEDQVTVSSARRFELMQKLSRNDNSVSRCIALRNMVTPQDLDEDLKGEVTEECGRFGKVCDTVIHHDVHGSGNVTVFILYSHMAESAKALQVLNNRYFGGRQISAEYYNEAKFFSKHYDG